MSRPSFSVHPRSHALAHHSHAHVHGHPASQVQSQAAALAAYRLEYYGVAAGHFPRPVHQGHQNQGPAARLPFARAPALAPVDLNHQLSPMPTSQHGCSAPLTMADPAAYLASDEEIAHLQKLSSEYEPEATGPLVGERQSSAAITTQYANADPVYRVKTAALPTKYAFFRTCRGDGHCGWRAIAFTYFEALLRVGHVTKLEDEEARLKSLDNLLIAIGYPHDIWIDFAEEAFDLLHKLADCMRAMNGAAEDQLLQAFNDVGQSMAIITYVKLLASAWVQTHADDFSHFVPMGDVKAYCSTNIEPARCEADNIGVAALAEVLIKPVGFGLEVWYLDRSPGEEINLSYCAKPTDHNHTSIDNAPMLRLLYRPGHYDILYEAGDIPQPVQHQPMSPQQPLQVAMVNYTDDFVPTASNVVDIMTMLPGIYPTSLGQRWSSLSYDFNPTTVPQSQATPIQSYARTPTPASPVSNSHLDFITNLHSNHVNQYNPPRHHSIHLDQPPVTLPIHPSPAPPVSIDRVAPAAAAERGGPFRPSMYELEPGFGSSMQVQSFQTSIFRNSHFNTAHFMNPDFQPEEWCPDGEYVTGNKGRHKP